MADVRRVLVLGGSGFIGSHLVQALLIGGWHVRVVSRRETLLNRDHYSPGQLDCLVGDIADAGILDRALDGIDVCIHLVHSTFPGESMANHERDLLETVVPTVRFLSSLSPRRLKRLVYVSSGGTVYGRAVSLPITEDHPTNPVSAYGVAKLTLEKYIGLFAETLDLNTAIVRPSNVYGPGQGLNRMQGAVGIFLNHILRDEPIRIWGDGSIVRDYLHVDDLVRAIEVVAADETPGVWNVGTGVGTSIRELVGLLERSTALSARIIYGPGRSYDVEANVLDASHLQRTSAWAPTIDLEQGIQHMVSAAQSTTPAPRQWWRVPPPALVSA